MTNPYYKCFFLRMFISNIKLATDIIVSLLTLFIIVFNLSLSDTVFKAKFSIFGTMKQDVKLVFYLV